MTKFSLFFVILTILILVLPFFQISAQTTDQKPLKDVLTNPRAILSNSQIVQGGTFTITWSYSSGEATTNWFSVISRPALQESGSYRCATTPTEKSNLAVQIIAPACLYSTNTVQINSPTFYFPVFCLYLQAHQDVDGELTVVSQSTSAVQSFTIVQPDGDFCQRCGSQSLGCDPVRRQCYCPVKDDGTTFYTSSCLTSTEMGSLWSQQCQWNAIDWSAGNSACKCKNRWSGSQCKQCSLSDCTGYSGTCFTCAAAAASEQPNVPNDDCSKCICSNTYYRGTTCACRGAIFSINGQFTYPSGNYTDITPTSTDTKATLAPMIDANIRANLHHTYLRMALALDLNIPISNIEIIQLWQNELRVAVSPWCLVKFADPWERRNVNPTIRESHEGSTAPMIMHDIEIFTQDFDSQQEDGQNKETLEKINKLKTLFLNRYGRSPLDNSQHAKESVLSQFSQQNIFESLSNTNSLPFEFLYNAVEEKLIKNGPTSYVSQALLAHESNPTPIQTTQIYFPNCSGDFCANLGPDHYAPPPSSDSILIIIIVIVAVVVVLAVAVISCLYCNSKKICCFKSIAEYNERKKRKAAEKAARDGSGSGTSHHSGSGSDKNKDGSNSSRPKTDSASGGTLTGSAYHGSSNSATNPENRNSSSMPSGYAPARRISATPSGGGMSSRTSTSRRTSQGGRNIEMSSTRNESRKSSRGGRSRNQSRIGGLRASNAAAAANARADIDDDDAEEIPLPVGWERAIAQDGKAYYVNTETLTSQWTHPSLPANEKEESHDDLEYVPE